jgi:hypothetical protein
MKIWSKKQGFEDSEYMFHKLGDWPDKYMLKYSDPVRSTSIYSEKTQNHLKPKLVRPEKSFTPKPIKKSDPSPWLFQPTTNSLFQPFRKKAFKIY